MSKECGLRAHSLHFLEAPLDASNSASRRDGERMSPEASFSTFCMGDVPCGIELYVIKRIISDQED